MQKKKIVFITGTRADYGKLKSLMQKVDDAPCFELSIFVTGMHMLGKYGATYREIEKDGFTELYKYINQSGISSMDMALSNTILGLSNYVAEFKPDLIVIHGDRLEALAGAIVGAFNNILVAHIEGGEVSGTIDESIRHAITKFSHLHFVSNDDAKNRIIQLGEKKDTIFIIGSPDVDIMYSNKLPSLEMVKKRYDIEFQDYSILMYHPVTTVSNINEKIKNIVDAVIDSNENFIVIYPNNDKGSDTIIDEYRRFENNRKIKMYSSVRFEYFLVLLKNSRAIVGNSSAGIREACVYGVPSVNVGDRQQGRFRNNEENKGIIDVPEMKDEIVKGIKIAKKLKLVPKSHFGDGNSDQKFLEVLKNPDIWKKDLQKKFVDIL